MKKFLIFLMLLIPGIPQISWAEELVVYSARKEQLIKPIFDAYTAATDVAIKYITDKEGPLLERLKTEGAQTSADVLITTDAGNLWHAAELGLLTEVQSEILTQNIPEHLRDPGNRWFGLSVRARTIVHSLDRVDPYELSTYENLATKEWRGRLCLRSSNKVYNQSLVAMMIAEKGVEETESIVRGWVANLATEPFADDTAVMEAIAAGQCDVGIVNTYYFGKLIQEKPDLPVALYWPNQSGNGVHVNISGAGLVRHSKHKETAVKFLEWLSSEKAQELFAGLNLEYPVNPKVKPNELVASWGEFKQNFINVSRAGELQQEAVKLMDRAGYK